MGVLGLADGCDEPLNLPYKYNLTNESKAGMMTGYPDEKPVFQVRVNLYFVRDLPSKRFILGGSVNFRDVLRVPS